MKKRFYFLHTIDGKPARFWPKGQICFLRFQGSAKLVRSLKQIKREQTLSCAWRTKRGYGNRDNNYGYVKVTL